MSYEGKHQKHNMLEGKSTPKHDHQLTLFRPEFLYCLKVQKGSLENPLVISGTITASPIKLCKVIVLLKVQMT